MESELEKQGVWIPVTPEKSSLSSARPPDPIYGDRETGRLGQSVSAGQFVVFNAVTSMDTNRELYNCDTALAAKQGTVDHNVPHSSSSGDLDQLTFMDLLALANTQPISASAFGSLNNTQSPMCGDNDCSVKNNANIPATHYDKPNQEKDEGEMYCEGETSQPASTNGKRLHNGLNLNKKSRQRKKKKKFWPKIAVEGKVRKAPKSRTPMSSTPAPKTPNQSTPKHATSKKRKNRRKKNLEMSSNFEEAIAEHAAKSNIKSCRRVLNFNAHNSCRRVLNYILDSHERENNDLSNMSNREDQNVTNNDLSNMAKREDQNVTNQGYNSLRVYRRVFQANKCLRNSKLLGPNFPKIFKKRRMERQKSIMHWGQRIASHTKKLERCLLVKMILPTKFQITEACGDPESFKCIFSLIPTIKSKQRRSFAFVHRLAPQSVGRGGSKSVSHLEKQGMDNNKHQHVDSLCPQVSPKGSQGMYSRLELVTPKVTLKRSQVMLDYIIRRLECFCINDGDNQLVVHDQNVHFSESGHRALVAYDDVKKRKLLPKVDLDPETLRVWNILMDKDGSGGFEGEDKEHEKWWEKQREVFRGRVDSFNSRLHHIQGSRRFSLWKGSVVDSVVGVFLTQNVSDHLSSSAFMSLAARFPLQSTSNHRECDLQGAAEEASDANGKQSLPRETAHDTSSELLRQREETIGTTRPISNEGEVERVVKDASALHNLDSLTGGNLSATFKSCTNETSGYKIDKLSCDETATDGNGMETQKQGSNLSDKVFDDLEGAYAWPGSDHHCSKVPLPPSDMEIDSLGLLGGFKNTKMNDKGDMSNNLEKFDDKCQILPSIDNNNSQRTKKSKVEEKQEKPINWDDLRKTHSCRRETTGYAMDSLDWEAVRRAKVEEVSNTIVERGMNNILAARIKEFLNRVVRDHGSLNLEWLRDIPPDKAKEYLLSIEGLGLKSTECVRLLSLHHNAFPVDTNVGRVAVRLGWVPLQPLPEELQMHLLDQYPLLNSIQKYLWPRLCTLDHQTLYELHYQMITFGKVFCTKRSPRCNMCPLSGECKHFASAFASAKHALPGPHQSSSGNPEVPVAQQTSSGGNPEVPIAYAQNPVLSLPPIMGSFPEENLSESRHQSSMDCEPIIEIPASPEYTESIERDIEDLYIESDDEIPTIKLNTETGEFKDNLLDYMDPNNFSVPGEKALVVLISEVASMPVLPKMKQASRLKTMHRVYPLPDDHFLLAGLDKRVPDDPNPYLLAVWRSAVGETANSSGPPKKQSNSVESELCNANTCSSFNNIAEVDSKTVPGTILIPCRTATRGSFPLNGTYFQVNEVFADDETSQTPIDVPEKSISHLPLLNLCCGTSATTIMRGFTLDQITEVFGRGFICVRAFNRKSRLPRRLSSIFHTSATDIAKNKANKTTAES